MPYSDPRSDMTRMMDDVLTNDPEIRAASRAFMLDGLRYMSRLLKIGSPEEKMAIMRMIVPHAMKALARQDTAQDDEQMKAIYERIVGYVRGT